MSAMEDKILGRTKEKITQKARIDPLTADYAWKVRKDGCGESLFNGVTVAQMMDALGREKARRGETRLTNSGFEFELCTAEAQ
jgi:hypothetical protein